MNLGKLEKILDVVGREDNKKLDVGGRQLLQMVWGYNDQVACPNFDYSQELRGFTPIVVLTNDNEIYELRLSTIGIGVRSAEQIMQIAIEWENEVQENLEKAKKELTWGQILKSLFFKKAKADLAKTTGEIELYLEELARVRAEKAVNKRRYTDHGQFSS